MLWFILQQSCVLCTPPLRLPGVGSGSLKSQPVLAQRAPGLCCGRGNKWLRQGWRAPRLSAFFPQDMLPGGTSSSGSWGQEQEEPGGRRELRGSLIAIFNPWYLAQLKANLVCSFCLSSPKHRASITFSRGPRAQHTRCTSLLFQITFVGSGVPHEPSQERSLRGVCS